MSTAAPVLTERSFEAEHLGGPVFDCADPERAAAAVEQARKAGAILVSCRTEGAGTHLSNAGFRKVETLVTFERKTAGRIVEGPITAAVRSGGVEDIPACRRIAVAALRWDRFHADPRIDDRAADTLKADWIENDLRGRADVTFVVEALGNVAGFCAMLLRSDVAVIDLIAVDPDRQGQGLGRALVAAALDHYRDRVAAMQVGTQAGNPSSLNFYRSMGFEEIRRADTWHWMP